MEVVSRIWFTPKQKAQLWGRWRNGQRTRICQSSKCAPTGSSRWGA